MSVEEPNFTVLDAYIRSQLAKAAETYASSTDIDARLLVILASGKDPVSSQGPAKDARHKYRSPGS